MIVNKNKEPESKKKINFVENSDGMNSPSESFRKGIDEKRGIYFDDSLLFPHNMPIPPSLIKIKQNDDDKISTIFRYFIGISCLFSLFFFQLYYIL